ncbi:hypothetical protein [Nocardia paucivorans]|uniref:hypothetical protein n=1 Tax=Nocardia paucivorans TaxID=114259 RepID=UPI0002DDAB6E|nr:hypothetical protein [Nocardia paucivorans]
MVVLVVVLALVVLAGGGVGGYLLYRGYEKDDGPAVDTSADLADAPMGCGLLTVLELAPLVPGTFGAEPTGILAGDRATEKSAQCAYSNRKTHRSAGLPFAFVVMTTRLHKAGVRESGVERAMSELRRKAGAAPVAVAGADDAEFRQIESSRGNITQAEITIRYHNIVITIIYHHDRLLEVRFAPLLLRLGEQALRKTLR